MSFQNLLQCKFRGKYITLFKETKKDLYIYNKEGFHL